MKESVNVLQEGKMIQDQIQNEAVQAWFDAGCIGTLNLGVGAGKTFCAFKALYRLQEEGLLTSEDLVLFKAERSNRWENTVVPEADKFESIFEKNPVKDFNIEFVTYQAQDERICKFLICDEIHDLASASRYTQLTNHNSYVLGLTGTPNESLYIFPDKAVPKLYMTREEIENKSITSQTTKGALYAMFCPIVYTKTEEELIDLDVLSPFETIIIWHELDKSKFNYNISAKWKATEELWWRKRKEYSDKLFEEAYTLCPVRTEGMSDEAYEAEKTKVEKKKASLIYQASLIKKVKMSKFLYTLKSKVEITNQILQLLNTPTIIFGVEKEPLWSITGNVVDDKKDAVRLVTAFNEGEIDVIATSKALQQGVTLKGLENIILHSFQSSSGQLIQTIGRVIRKVDSKVGRVYIIVTRGTYEEKWLVEMQKVKDSKSKTTRQVNLNIVAEIESNQITKENLKLC